MHSNTFILNGPLSPSLFPWLLQAFSTTNSLPPQKELPRQVNVFARSIVTFECSHLPNCYLVEPTDIIISSILISFLSHCHSYIIRIFQQSVVFLRLDFLLFRSYHHIAVYLLFPSPLSLLVKIYTIEPYQLQRPFKDSRDLAISALDVFINSQRYSPLLDRSLTIDMPYEP